MPESRVRGVLFARRSKVPIEYQADTEVLAYWSAVELVCSPASLLDSAYASIVKRERGSNPQLVNEERIELPLDSALARGFLPFIEDEPALAGAQARTLART